MEALQVLKERRSVRRFLQTPVSKEILMDLVNCGHLAATGRNVQPWHFVVVTEPERKKKLAAITEYGKFIADAPACIVVLCDDVHYLVEDGAAATQNILLAAKAYGLGSCWVAGHKKPYMKEIEQTVNAPEGVRLFSLIALGYSEESPVTKKKSLDEVLVWESF